MNIVQVSEHTIQVPEQTMRVQADEQNLNKYGALQQGICVWRSAIN